MDSNAERQLVESWDDARADHRRRYEWADRHFPTQGLGLDAFCGCGYGTQMLVRNIGRTCLGIDGDEESINHARRHFFIPRKTTFSPHRWPNLELIPRQQFDFVASLESVEHVAEPERLVAELVDALKIDGVIVISTPNQDLLPKTRDSFPFHHKHFTFHETLKLLELTERVEVFDWGGQDVYMLNDDKKITGLLPEEWMEVHDRRPGQFHLVAARRIK